MMTQNIIRIKDAFSIRDNLRLNHSGNIFTSDLMMLRRWNQMFVQRIQQDATADSIVHICPLHEGDWEQYAQLSAYIAHTYVWMADKVIPPTNVPRWNVSFIQCEQMPATERFVILKTDAFERALISWQMKNGYSQGILVTDPSVVDNILDHMEMLVP